ncbi:MAG: hypothetical protein QXY01_03335 [Candidatus Bathyarchaeia archaeon]
MMSSIYSRPVERALSFIDTLRVDDTRSEYYEVAEQGHSEHRVYNQSQYLLSILFKKVGRNDLAQKIRMKHPPDEPDNDLPRRKGHRSNDRWCILEGDIKPFYLANRINSSYNDEKALIALYWLERNRRQAAERLWNDLYSRYDPVRGVLQMDKADAERNLYPVYKIALFGILAKRIQNMEVLANIQKKLVAWQHRSGGWETDRKIDLTPDGVANLETTVLSTMALLP